MSNHLPSTFSERQQVAAQQRQAREQHAASHKAWLSTLPKWITPYGPWYGPAVDQEEAETCAGLVWLAGADVIEEGLKQRAKHD